MKLIASFVSLTVVAALSAWLWLGQGASEVQTAGVEVVESSGSAASGFIEPLTSADNSVLTDDYAAAFVGLQAVLDVWHNQPREVISDPELLAGLVADAREAASAEIAAVEEKARQEAAAEQKAREKAAAEEKARQEAAAEEEAREEAAQPPKAVSPPPVAPPPDDDDDDDDDNSGPGHDDDDDDDDWDDDDGDDDDDDDSGHYDD